MKTLNSWLITITNDGLAIDDSLLMKMNSNLPYMPSSSGGLGLGISLVKSISERNGISIKFQRRESGGIIASIYIKKDNINE